MERREITRALMHLPRETKWLYASGKAISATILAGGIATPFVKDDIDMGFEGYQLTSIGLAGLAYVTAATVYWNRVEKKIQQRGLKITEVKVDEPTLEQPTAAAVSDLVYKVLQYTGPQGAFEIKNAQNPDKVIYLASKVPLRSYDAKSGLGEGEFLVRMRDSFYSTQLKMSVVDNRALVSFRGGSENDTNAYNFRPWNHSSIVRNTNDLLKLPQASR